MTLKNFVKQFDALNAREEKEAFVKEHIVRTYIPFVELNSAAERSVKASHVEPTNDGSEKFVPKTQVMRVFQGLDMIELFTDIKFDRIKDGVDKVYDELKSRGVMDIICDQFNIDEYECWYSAYDDAVEDLKWKMTSTYAMIGDITNRVKSVINEVGIQVEEAMQKAVDNGLADEVIKQIGTYNGT